MADVKKARERSDLRSWSGVMEAQEKLYNDIADNEVDIQKGTAMSRIIRNQSILAVEYPTRLLGVLNKMKDNPIAAEHSQNILKRVVDWSTREPEKQLQ